jgi:hypothetical protein
MPKKKRKKFVTSELLKEIDVEEAFTFLSERAFSESVPEDSRRTFLKIWEILVSSTGRSLGKFNANNETRFFYKSFTNKLLKQIDAIVSFNYDVICEQSLPTKTKWHYEGVSNSQKIPRSIPIIKPHGSVNWRIENQTIVTSKSVQDNPLIVAPSHLKFVSNREEDQPLFQVWQRMEQQLSAAKVIVFIGYSFPPSDFYFSSVLRTTFAERSDFPQIVIVNPDAVNISARLQQRYRVGVKQILKLYDLDSLIRCDRAVLRRDG